MDDARPPGGPFDEYRERKQRFIDQINAAAPRQVPAPQEGGATVKRGPIPALTRGWLIQYVGRGLTRQQVAAKLGCNLATVRAAERRHQIWLHPLPERISQWTAQVLRANGASTDLIMSVLGRSEQTVHKYLLTGLTPGQNPNPEVPSETRP
jgi:DNA-binding CsgD family transcriptional regulator